MSTFWVRHAPDSVALVRRLIVDYLDEAGINGEESFTAALIASELVSNAVRHAPPLPAGNLAIGWQLEAGSYTISVTDGGRAAAITPRDSGPDAASGRGLAIVAAIAESWGVEGDDEHTTVWARRSFTHPVRWGGSVLSHSS